MVPNCCGTRNVTAGIQKTSDSAVRLATLELSYAQAGGPVGSVKSTLCRWVGREQLRQPVLSGEVWELDGMWTSTPSNSSEMRVIRDERGTAEVDALPFSQQLGEAGVVGTGLVGAGQPHHSLRLRLPDGVVWTAASMAMSQGGGSFSLASIQEPSGVPLGYSENLCRLGRGDPEFQDVVEDMEPCQILLFQCHFLHGWTVWLTGYLLTQS